MKLNLILILFIIFFTSCSLNNNDNNYVDRTLNYSSDSQDVYYISNDGKEYSNCSQGSLEEPWKNVQILHKNNCIKPGAKIYFLQGKYYKKDLLFSKYQNKPSITFNGKKDKPVLFKSLKGKESVIFELDSLFIDGSNIIIEDIEIFGVVTDSNKGIIQLGGENIVLKNIHVYSNKGSENSGKGFDCIKILGTARNIHILNSEIAYCGEDAIDVTGARGVVYKNNLMHHAEMIQVKGGTENIEIINNTIHNFKFGIQGFGMSCPGKYCGGEHIVNLPIEDRYVAKNISIINNKFFEFEKGVIGPGGYLNALIKNNTFYDIESYILNPHKAGFDFYDNIARNYCLEKSCSKCKTFSKNCWNIQFSNKNVKFLNNIVENEEYIINDNRLDSEIIIKNNIIKN